MGCRHLCVCVCAELKYVFIIYLVRIMMPHRLIGFLNAFMQIALEQHVNRVRVAVVLHRHLRSMRACLDDNQFGQFLPNKNTDLAKHPYNALTHADTHTHTHVFFVQKKREFKTELNAFLAHIPTNNNTKCGFPLVACVRASCGQNCFHVARVHTIECVCAHKY